jgi:CorA-like Mg2+ transporter protein
VRRCDDDTVVTKRAHDIRERVDPGRVDPVVVRDDNRHALAELAPGSGPTGELDGPTFLAAILGWVLHEYESAFERLEDELEELDERTMLRRASPEATIDQLIVLRRRSGGLRRSLASVRSPLLALTHPELEALG